ncbi:MAG: topoisomerase protein [Candidatus Giovannonibacteria bacterium GW2011_GWA2_53_7]|uniref:Omega-protein n=1 Tax=Candidatus Giovannonibacteria bacterium GW2011_GWA2_53_7 TaxID=1618650 RepID=A0A0G1XVV0_9BACT|nr:MAG: topoisomerase protein [Candidatus Giovannonibacteria bacterium GW2011_GWA2_53_7]
MAKKLVIVESPTKAKTISRFLGSDFVVTSSMGHVRDLPKRELGVDVAHGFTPRYVVPKKNQLVVTSLKKTADKSEAVYFATDEDREGEAISWHLADLLKIDPTKVKRITFDEITKEAVLNAVQNPRAIDQHLVDAQQARRVLDRLVGYELSPFLWKKVVKGLSAGRVQSVAVRLIVEREREILAFKAQEYWTLDAEFKNKADAVFPAKLSKVGDKALDKFGIANEAEAKKIHGELASAGFAVSNVEEKTVQKNPLPPFTTYAY